MTRRLRVLVVDDEPIVGHRLTPALTKIGCEVDAFVDPEAALTRLQDIEYDIVVTDIRMQPIDGIQILERVLAVRPAHQGHPDHRLRHRRPAREAIAKGAFDFIAKPFKPNELRKVIEKAAASLRSDDAGV